MPLIVILKSGQRIDLPGESYAALRQSARLGTINLLDDEGNEVFLEKSEIALCKQISAERHKAQIEAQRREQEAQEKQRADDAAKRRAEKLSLDSRPWWKKLLAGYGIIAEKP